MKRVFSQLRDNKLNIAATLADGWLWGCSWCIYSNTKPSRTMKHPIKLSLMKKLSQSSHASLQSKLFLITCTDDLAEWAVCISTYSKLCPIVAEFTLPFSCMPELLHIPDAVPEWQLRLVHKFLIYDSHIIYMSIFCGRVGRINLVDMLYSW